MRILHLLCFPLFGSGSGTFVRKLAEKTASEFPDSTVGILCPDKKRHIKDVKVIPLQMPFPVAFTGHPDWPNTRIYSELTAEEMIEVIDSFRSQAIKTVQEFKPDVIHVHHASIFASVASLIRAIYDINYIVTIHGTGILCASQDKRWRPIVRPGLVDAFLINAVSGDTGKWTGKIFGHNLLKKTKIITGGVDIEAFAKDGPTDMVDAKYELSDQKVVIFAGKLTKKKGVEYLIKAAPQIDAKIFIIGGGDDEDRLKQICTKVKAKNVIFAGYKGKESIEEFRQFYRRADVFVFPSVWDEPLGLVALEAMSSSTPVVASKKGGIPLAVKHGHNGYLVRARSAKDIAKMVNKIIKNPELQQKLAENARKTVEGKFNWKNIGHRFNDIYEQALENSRKRKKTKGVIQDKELIEREKSEIKGNKLDYI